MKNLILSAACGIDPKKIEFFLRSLRKYYKEDVIFLINKEDIITKKFLEDYNCQSLEISEHKFDVQNKRYFHYLKILEQNNYNNILLCDSRDIYFQSNPFDYRYKGSINFFLEDKKISDCPFNSNWLIKTYSYKIFKDLSNKIIICSGTTIGNYEGVKSYLKLMTQEISTNKYRKKLKYLLTFRRDKGGRGSDQANANYIAHNNLIRNSFFYSNLEGPIATVFHLGKIKFNKRSELINKNDEPYSIVHQYDKRWNEFKKNVEKIKIDLGLT